MAHSENGKGQTMSSMMDTIANNSWLRVVDRFAIPIIGILIYQQWQSVRILEERVPVMELRVSAVEKMASKVSDQLEAANTDRQRVLITYTNMITEIAGNVGRLQTDVKEINLSLKELAKQVDGETTQ